MMEAEQLAMVAMGKLLELESQLADLEKEKAILRQAIEEYVITLPNWKWVIPGTATVTITTPAPTVSYDARSLDSLLSHFTQVGDMESAHRLALLREEKSRNAVMRIVKDKSNAKA